MCREIYVFFLFFLWVSAHKIIVKVKQGKLMGHREATVFDDRLYFAFYGVPYAQAPINNLRFKDPQPVKKWNGTFDASLPFYGACAQTHIVHKYALYGIEDCLYLNIYTPDIPKDGDKNLKPVIVWIHGYAFTSSFSHLHGPDFLVHQGIIVITVTHRIGVFGFLKLNDNDSHANMGLKDIFMALKWIKNNVKYFGGDKNQITLMASGSGATFVSLLLTTEANNYFSKIVLHSGAIFSPSIFQGDHASERNKLSKELKRKHLKLEDAPTKEIIAAAHNINIRNSKEMENLQRAVVPFTPMIEPDANTSLLVWTSEEFYDTIKRKQLYVNKPILIGYNTQESISEVIPFIHNPYYLKSYIKHFRFIVPFSNGCSFNSSTKIYKKLASIIKDRYFKETDTEKSLGNLLTYVSDLLKYPILKFVKTHLHFNKNKMFMYKFDYRGIMNAVKRTSLAEQNVKVAGVASGDELCYIFRCEPLWETYKRLTKDKDSKDKKFIKAVSKLWANFAKFGDPTPLKSDSNVTWRPVNLNFDNVLLIRKYFMLVSDKEDNAVFDFWELLYETYYRKEICGREHDEL